MNLSKHIDSASDAFKDWKKIPFEDRQKLLINLADVLEKNKEKFGKTITTEMHKPISQAIAEIEKLSETVGIPKKLTELGIQEKDFDFDYLSKNALIDACAPGNPFMPTLEETIAFYKELF